jgi:hypothetical protein
MIGVTHMQKKDHNQCPFSDEIVSYMYDEMPAKAALEFEQHLEACGVCTDDFAAVAVARFETYDWKRTVFDPLPTPRIVIPYPQKTVTFGERISAWRSWVTVVPVAAALLLCLGVAAYIVSLNIGSKTESTIAKGPQVDQHPNTVAPSPVAVDIASGDTKNAVQPVKARQVALKRKAGLPRSTFARRTGPVVRLTNDYAVNISPSQLKPAPRLGMKDDEDDRSLRLADLFDETKPPQR